MNLCNSHSHAFTSALPTSAFVPSHVNQRTHRRVDGLRRKPVTPVGSWQSAAIAKPHGAGSELEPISLQGELIYEPRNSHTPEDDQESKYAELLDTWDQAVANRNVGKRKLLAPKQPIKAVGSTSSSSQTKPQTQHQGKHKKRPRGKERVLWATDPVLDRSFHAQLNSPDLPLLKQPDTVRLSNSAFLPPEFETDIPSLAPPPTDRPISVKDVLLWMDNQAPDHIRSFKIDELVREADPRVMHTVMKLHGQQGRASDIERVLTTMVSTGMANTHTWGQAFMALSSAGFNHVAMGHFEKACRNNIDIGPAGASVLIKLCAQTRNLELALDLYYKMCSVRMTLNAYTYNCLLHLCGVLGRVNDALDVLTNMRSEAQNNSSCRPDAYTYSALLHAITAGKRWELLNDAFFSMLQDQIGPEPEVWCLLILGAGRSDTNASWAANYWKGYMRALKPHKLAPDTSVVNAYLWTLSKDGQLEEMQQIFSKMSAWGCRPDSYTFVAMLTAMARAGSSLEDVLGMLRIIRTRRVLLNTHIGTALLNAYRHTPELTYQVPGQMDIVIEQTQELMRELVGRRMATPRSFTVFAILYIMAGKPDVVPRILQDAQAVGCVLDAECYHHLHLACEEEGLSQMSQQLSLRRNQMIARAKAARLEARKKRAAFDAWVKAAKDKEKKEREERKGKREAGVGGDS